MVEVDCQFDPTTGIAKWIFRGRDPNTGELADLLPPNTDEVAPLGEAWISYSVKQKPNLPTGTRIKNMATIDFEIGIPPEPMNTPMVFNTIDSGAPSSHVKTLTPTVPTANFTVSWEGADDENGSGIRDYDIYVSEDGGNTFNRWLSNTTQTSATFNGICEHTYWFYSRAEDIVGNVEATPPAPDAFTKVEVSGWVMELKEGWSLISFPVNKCFYYGTPPPQPNYVNMENLGDEYGSLAEWFDSVIIPNNPVDKPWQMVIGINGAMDSSIASNFHSLKSMSPLSGYWVKIKAGTGGVKLCLDGELLDPGKAIPLITGWNLAGCTLSEGYHDTENPPSSVRLPEGVTWKPVSAPVAGSVLKSIEDKYSAVMSEYGAYNPNLEQSLSSMHYMSPGYGYWINMKEDADLVYSPGTGGASVLAAPGDRIFEQLPVPPTRTSMLIYGSMNFDEMSGNIGNKIRIFSQSGVLCSQAEVTQDGNYGIMLVYGDDTETSEVEGAKIGEKLVFYIVEGNEGNNPLNPPLLRGNYSDGLLRGSYGDSDFVIGKYDRGERLEAEVGWMGDKTIMRVDLTSRPKTSKLLQNYPNPFNPDTWIPYQLKSDSNVTINIYSVNGQLVKTLSLGYKPAGFYTGKERSAYWDGKNETGENVASGVYFYNIAAGELTDTRKMVIVR